MRMNSFRTWSYNISKCMFFLWVNHWLSLFLTLSHSFSLPLIPSHFSKTNITHSHSISFLLNPACNKPLLSTIFNSHSVSFLFIPHLTGLAHFYLVISSMCTHFLLGASTGHGLGGLVSAKADVYSHGILLIETFSGKKKPTNAMFETEMSLKQWRHR